MGVSANEQCNFASIDLPCEFCQTRNLPVCLKKLGQKSEEVKSRVPPTPDDSVIPPQDVLLLQFAYSDEFANSAGLFIRNLFRRFSFMFGPSINNQSLRHATLAWAAASVGPRVWLLDRMLDHSSAA